MNRTQEMNDFLQKISRIITQNPDGKYNADFMYSQLSTYGLDANELNDRDISFYIESWINRFKNTPNLRVYDSSQQPGFLQFSNRSTHTRDHVKLYLSYPKDTIYRCANKIFDFIASNNLPSNSKVSKRLRADSIVLRIGDLESAVQVINFINSDPDLVKYSKPANPFICRHGAVSFAYDNALSYNSTLSDILEAYFNMCKNNNRLNQVSADDLRKYVSNLQDFYFRNIEGIRQFMWSTSFVASKKRFDEPAEELLNYRNVFELIANSLNGNMGWNDYATFYNKTIDPYNKQRELDYFRNSINIIENNQTLNQDDKTEIINENDVVAKRKDHMFKIFTDACAATYEKYGYRHFFAAIDKALNGDFSSITNDRENNKLYRKQLLNNGVNKYDVASFCSKLIKTYQPNFTSGDYISSYCFSIQKYIDEQKTQTIKVG